MAAADDKVRGTAHGAFRFLVAIDGEEQAAFTQCTLPTIAWDVEEIKEGGLNTSVHQLPAQRKSATVQLKNGVGKSTIMDWYLESMGNVPTRRNVTITLLDITREPVMIWRINDAFPIQWSGPELKSDGNIIAIQSLELACGEITAAYE